jgi:hypothetical protein
MTVSDLIAALKTMPQHLPVIVNQEGNLSEACEVELIEPNIHENFAPLVHLNTFSWE